MIVKRLLTLIILTALLLGPSGIAPAPQVSHAQVETQLDVLERFWNRLYEHPLDDPVSTQRRYTLLTKATPDECYAGVGNPYPPGPPCDDGQAKVNEGYLFGLTKTNSDLWIGTVTNMPCLVLSQLLGIIPPHETFSWTCEFGESAFGKLRFPGDPQLQNLLGDWRPPHIYVYNLDTGVRLDKTPPDPLIDETLGLRSAGNQDGVVLLGGPTLSAWTGVTTASVSQGVNMFAYRASDGAYLGSANLPEFNNIRKWVSVDGILYAAVGVTAGGGGIIRWRGTAADPFQFEVVGQIDNDGANIALHDGRLFVTTWPNQKALLTPGAPIVMSGLFMSPPIPAGGLDSSHMAAWQKVWQASDYEPDPVTAITYMGGALASYGGYLYWGSMHFPFLGAAAHLLTYGTPTDPVDLTAKVLGTFRPANIFRGRNFGTPAEETQVLYGLAEMPVYIPGSPGHWEIQPNKMGPPLYGLAGFGNFFNTYTWTMAPFENQLFVGTFDWSYLFPEVLGIFVYLITGSPPPDDLQLPSAMYGADLFRFRSTDLRALPVSISGVGNPTNYGIRTMLADDALYLGMANPMNLLTDPNDKAPEGGWELVRLSSRPITAWGAEDTASVLFLPVAGRGR